MLLKNLRLVKIRRKQLLTLIFITSLSVILFLTVIPYNSIIINFYYWARPDKGVFCHTKKSESSLPDISDTYPKKGESIFFHETSCTSYIYGKIIINSRQACAVESAARLNPEYDVYLLYASPGNFRDENTESDRFIKKLMKYKNVHILHVDMEKYMKGSPVENLWKEKQMTESHFAQSHTSDVLRYLTLWKYGGIYLDLDIIVIKNLAELGTDFAGVESDTAVAAGILSFNHTGVGHDFATSCLNDLKNNFNGHDWGYNGPGTVTRLLKNICGVNQVSQMLDRSCRGFKVHPKNEFYAIPWWDWKWFVDGSYLKSVKEYTNNSYIIHVWNKFSGSTRIPLDSDAPYLDFAKKYCPNIVQQCDEYF